MNQTINRRVFIKASSAGAAACTGVTTAAHPLFGLRPPAEKARTPVRVKKLYLAKPIPTWPTPHLDVKKEREKLEGILSGLQPEMSDITFEGGELLRTIDDVPPIMESLKNVDGILIFNLTSTVGHMVRAIADSGKPTLLFSQPYSGHDWSIVAEMQDQGLRIDVIASSDYRDILAGMKPIRAIRRLADSKILVLRTAERDDEPVAERLGVKIVPLQHERLMAAYHEVAADAVEQEADDWAQGALQIVEPSRHDIVSAARMALAMHRVLEQEQAQAITINCLGLFYAGKLPAYPCLGFSRLNDAGLVGACEADVDSTMTMLLFQYLTGRPGFISDPVIDTATGTVIHAHCVAPTRMDGPTGPRAPYILRSHMEDDKGVAPQVRMRVGQKITMAKLVSDDSMLLSTARIVSIPESDRGCRTKIATQVSDAQRLLQRYRHGLHRVIFYGDHRQDVARLSRYLGFKITYEV